MGSSWLGRSVLVLLVAAAALGAGAASASASKDGEVVCSEKTRLHKTTALMLQGYLGAFGSGAWYTGHEGLGVASMGALGLVALGLVLRMCVFRPIPTTGRAAMEARRLTNPAEVAKGDARSNAIVGALVYGGVSLMLLLWLAGQVGIMADWILPANGCGWALRAAAKSF